VTEPVTSTGGLLGLESDVLVVELLRKEVEDKVGQTLTHVRIDGDAEAQAIFRDELDAGLEVFREVRGRISCDNAFPQVLGGYRNL
jgi:hypothetical protein